MCSEISVVGEQPNLDTRSTTSFSMVPLEAGGFDSQLERPSSSMAASEEVDHHSRHCCSSKVVNRMLECHNSQNTAASSTLASPRSAAASTSSRRSCWRPLAAVALGQFLSLLIAATGFISSHLARVGIDAPMTQSFCNYALLALVYGSLLLYRRKKLQVHWFWYLILAIIDVEANYLALRAYQYTSITSVMLLDRVSLPFVLALTWIIFNTSYTVAQVGGIGVCVGGVVILFLSDMHPRTNFDANQLIKGDILVVSGSILYATSNVVEELLARKHDSIELMATLGFFGSIISMTQVFIFELSTWKSRQWNLLMVMQFMGYATSLFTFYTIVPFFLKMNGSTMLNISLITCDMWAILLQKFSYHQKINTLYFVAFAMVGLGLIMYSLFTRSPQVDLMQAKEDETFRDKDTRCTKERVEIEIKV